MVEKDAVSKDFRKQVIGYGLTTAEIVYRRPDRHWLLQTYVWQDYDMFPDFPALKDFLAFWETKLEGPLFAVTVAHSKLIKPAELRAVAPRILFLVAIFTWPCGADSDRGDDPSFTQERTKLRRSAARASRSY